MEINARQKPDMTMKPKMLRIKVKIVRNVMGLVVVLACISGGGGNPGGNLKPGGDFGLRMLG